jgi:hypothetical protein
LKNFKVNKKGGEKSRLIRNGKGRTVAWVDNFIVFANTDKDAELIMRWIIGQLAFFRITTKEVDKSGEFLGLQKRKNGNLNLQHEWIRKTNTLFREVNNINMHRKTLQRLLGRIIWLNLTIVRSPLAKFPQTLQMAREVAINDNGTIQLSTTQKDELHLWKSLLYHQLQPQKELKCKIAWSDATPHTIAVIVNNNIYSASSPTPISIAIAESIGAGWAYLLAGQAAHLIVDNTTAGYAFAKGHCKEDNINTIIDNVTNMNTHTTRLSRSTNTEPSDDHMPMGKCGI